MTLRIELDRHRCEGYGFCEERAPELLRLDDEGELELLLDQVPDKERAAATSAVRSCPVAALTLSES